MLRDYGYVDSRGMGVRTKIIPLMRRYNHTEPVFDATEDYLTTVLKRGPENIPQETEYTHMRDSLASPDHSPATYIERISQWKNRRIRFSCPRKSEYFPPIHLYLI